MKNKQFSLWVNRYLLFNDQIKNRIKAWCKEFDYPAYLFANRAVIDDAGIAINDEDFNKKTYLKLSSKLTEKGIPIGQFISLAILNMARVKSIITDEEYNQEVKNVKRK